MSGYLNRRELLRLGAATFAVAHSPRILLSAGLAGADFSFIQLTDTHLSRSRMLSKSKGYDVSSKESIRRSRATVQEIERCALPYELILHTGDLADTTRDEDLDLAQEILRFSKPTYFVPGNHDIGYSEAGKNLPGFEKRFGKANQSIEPVAGLRIVLFNSQPLDPRASEKDREEAFAELEKMLTQPMPTILACHCMGFESFYNNQMDPGWPQATRDRWTGMMKKGGVEAVLAGHFHRDELYVAEGIPFYIAGPVIHFWGRQTSFRHWSIKQGVLSYRTLYPVV